MPGDSYRIIIGDLLVHFLVVERVQINRSMYVKRLRRVISANVNQSPSESGKCYLQPPAALPPAGLPHVAHHRRALLLKLARSAPKMTSPRSRQ